MLVFVFSRAWQPRWPWAWAALVAMAVGLLAAPTFAQPVKAFAPGGRVSVGLPLGGRGPLVLTPGLGGGYGGEIIVRNVGGDPLVISRVAVLGDEEDPRSPSHVSVRFAEGAPTRATLAPAASRTLLVSWSPPDSSRVRQAFGHVVITSTDEATGEVTVGFRAQTPTGLGWLGEHALSVLALFPPCALLLAAIPWGRRKNGARGPWLAPSSLAAAASGLELALAVWAFRRFVPDLTGPEGNGGFQLIERTVWVPSAAVEWYVGVDGASMPLVLLAALSFFAAVLVSSTERRDPAYFLALAVLAGSTIGVLVALNLALLLACFVTAMTALVVLVFCWGGASARAVTDKLLVYAVLASVALLLAVTALSRASGPSYLGDGTATAHTLAIPDLARTSYESVPALLGYSVVEVAWLLLLVVVAAISPVLPLHGWLADVLEQAPPGAALFVGGALTALGPYLLLRLGIWAMPEGARWAGPSVAALGALSALWASLCAMVQSDARRFVAYASVVSAGMALYGAGALTSLGVAGVGLGLFARGLAAVLLLGTSAAIANRLQVVRSARLSGLAADAPTLATLGIVGLAASVGAPGCIGAWPLLLDLFGGFARSPALALVFAVALLVSVAAHLRIAGDILSQGDPPVWRESPALAAFQGRLPDATSRELLALAPIAILAVALGIWPTPVLTPALVRATDGEARAFAR